METDIPSISRSNELKVAAFIAAVCMVSVCAAAAVVNWDDGGSDDDSLFIITAENLGIADSEMDAVFQNLDFDTIYILTDDNDELYAETSDSIDNGRTGVERIHDGIRIYLSSDAVNAIISGEAGALTALIGTMITSVAGAVVFGGITSVITNEINKAIMDGLDWNNGITVDVKLYKHRHILGVTIKTPVEPKIMNIGRQ